MVTWSEADSNHGIKGSDALSFDDIVRVTMPRAAMEMLDRALRANEVAGSVLFAEAVEDEPETWLFVPFPKLQIAELITGLGKPEVARPGVVGRVMDKEDFQKIARILVVKGVMNEAEAQEAISQIPRHAHPANPEAEGSEDDPPPAA